MAEEIRAELVGNVMTVVACPGDSLVAGDTVVLIESMKMEIPVITEDGGVLRSIEVQEGQVVQEGDLIAVVDSAAS